MELKAVAELAHRKVFPYGGDENANLLAEFIATAKLYYAYEVWKINRENKQMGEGDLIPSHLISRGQLIPNGNYASYEHLSPLLSLNENQWIQGLGDIDCDCDKSYSIMSLQQWRIYCKDQSRTKKAAIVLKNEIHFPEGFYETPIEIWYANMGEDIDDNLEIDDAIGAVILERLFDFYAKKFPVDKTNNSNPNE